MELALITLISPFECFLAQCFARLQNLFRPSADPVVLGKVYPAHYSRRVYNELRWSRDVLPIDAGACVNQIVTSNRLCPGIRKKRERVTSFLPEILRNFRRIYADRNRTNSRLMEVSQTLLDAPQLGVARRSPVTPVENQQHASGLC